MTLTLEIKRIVPAAPPVVFGAFSTPDELAQWWGPDGFTAPSLDFNPSVGDRYRIEMQPLDGDAFYLTGEFREVDPPGGLAYTFSWEDPDPDDAETLVELSFRDLGESTEVVVTQGPFNTEARRELHRNGWTESLDKLEQWISEGPALGDRLVGHSSGAKSRGEASRRSRNISSRMSSRGTSAL